MKKLALSLIFIGLSGVSFAEDNIYSQHLPEEVYRYCKKNHLLDENSDETHRERLIQEPTVLDIFSSDRDGEEILELHYSPAMDAHIKTLILGYQKGKLLGYALIDHEGKDYVSSDEISPDDEEECTEMLLKKLLPGLLEKN